MRYNTLYNFPREREFITYSNVWWDNGFTNDELNVLENLCSAEDMENGVTFGGLNEEIRNSKIKFFNKNAETEWIFNRFNFIGQSLNEQFYGFDLNGYESFQYTYYDGSIEGKYDWHMDMSLGQNVGHIRKLTMVLLLSDPETFTGGELQINEGMESTPTTLFLPRGKVVAFPSFMIHRVTPVLSGVRKSIVIWIEGPKFR